MWKLKKSQKEINCRTNLVAESLKSFAETPGIIPTLWRLMSFNFGSTCINILKCCPIDLCCIPIVSMPVSCVF